MNRHDPDDKYGICSLCCGEDRCCCTLFHIKTGIYGIAYGLFALGIISLVFTGLFCPITKDLINKGEFIEVENTRLNKPANSYGKYSIFGTDIEPTKEPRAKVIIIKMSWSLVKRSFLAGIIQILFAILFYILALRKDWLLCGTFWYILACTLCAFLLMYALADFQRVEELLKTSYERSLLIAYWVFVVVSLVLMIYFVGIADFHRRYLRYSTLQTTQAIDDNFQRHMDAKAGFT